MVAATWKRRDTVTRLAIFLAITKRWERGSEIEGK